MQGELQSAPSGRFYWAVRLWWREGENAVETGGHFTAYPADTCQSVVEDVIRVRGLLGKVLFRVEVELVDSGRA